MKQTLVTHLADNSAVENRGVGWKRVLTREIPSVELTYFEVLVFLTI